MCSKAYDIHAIMNIDIPKLSQNTGCLKIPHIINPSRSYLPLQCHSFDLPAGFAKCSKE